MADGTIRLDLEAKIDGIQQALGQLPNVGEKEAKKLVAAMRKQFKEVDKEAARSAKAAEKEWSQGIDSISKASEKLLDMAGLSGLKDIIFDLGGAAKGASGAIGAVGSIVAASAVAVAAFTAGIVTLGNASVAALDRLEKVGLASDLPPGAVESVDDYSEAMEMLWEAVDKVTVVMGSVFTGTLAKWIGLAAIAIEKVVDFAGWLGQMKESLGLLGQGLEYMIPIWGQFKAGVDAAAWATGGMAKSTVDLRQAQETAEKSTIDMYTALGLLADDAQVDAETRKRTAAELKAEADARDAAAAAAKRQAEAIAEGNEFRKAELGLFGRLKSANEQLAAIAGDLASDTLTDEQKIIAAYEERQKKIDELGKSASDTGAYIRASQENELRMNRELAASEAEVQRIKAEGAAINDQLIAQADEYAGSLRQVVDTLQVYAEKAAEFLGYVIQVYGALSDAMIAGNEREIESLEEKAAKEEEAAQRTADAWFEAEKSRVQSMLERGQLTEKEAAAEMKRINQEMAAKQKAINQLSKDEQKAAREAFSRNKKMQIAMAKLEAARAVVAALAGSGAGGPLATAAAVATAVITGAAQIAAIKAAEPPTFPTGGMVMGSAPDHVTIGATVGEAVLSRRGVEAAGGPAGIAQLNAGTGGLGGRVVVQLGRRTLAEALIDATGGARLDPRFGQVSYFGAS